MTSDAMTDGAVSFEDMVTAATVGVSRRPLALDGDPAKALLDAAALETVARRAGYQPPRDVTPPPAPTETGPAGTVPTLSARAARALWEACGWEAGRFPADNLLLPDLLDAAARAGYVAHPLLLPGLLDAAVRRVALRAPVAAVLGARGRWLARHRPDWAPMADMAVPQSPAAAAADPRVWRTGRSAQRIAFLKSLREQDPDAARELLADGWATETSTDRGHLIAVLERGLSQADEEFLEAALDDRASTVRAMARRMLARLPESALRRRARGRAEGVLRLERDGRGSRLAATLPGAPDNDALRDGLTVSPPSPSTGAGAWLLTQVIAGVPLDEWATRFGRSPAKIVALPVARDLAADVHAGWRFAALRQANAEWARALLTASDPGTATGSLGRDRPRSTWPPDQDLAGLLPPAGRAARVAALLADMPLNAANPPGWSGNGAPLLNEICGWPGPWPDVLADAVLDVFARVDGLPVLPSTARTLLNATGRGLPATGDRDYAARLTRMADACPHAWVSGLRAAAETVLLRRVFLREIGR